MTILFASTDYPEPGQSSTGLPTYLKRISTVLTKKGHIVIIVYGAMYNQHRFDGDVEVFAVRTPVGIRLDNELQTTRIRCLLRGYYINQKISQIISERTIDIVQFTSLEGISLFYSETVPAVIRLSSYAKLAFSSKFSTLSQDIVDFYSTLELDAGRHIENVFGPSEPTANAYGDDLGKTIRIIESPFWPIEKLDDSIYVEKLSTCKYVLFFGKMYAEKGIVEICDILKDFLLRNDDYSFVFVGGDAVVEGKSAYTLICESAGECLDRVYIFSEMKQKQLFSLVEHAEFVVLPSFMENFSNACIEAMYYNGCVVAYYDAGFEQLIENEKSGFLCKNGDSKELLLTVNKVVDSDESILSKIRENARIRLNENTPDVIVNKLIKYYTQVISDMKNKKYVCNKFYYKEIKKYIDSEFQLKNAEAEADKRYLNSRVLAEWTNKLMQGKDPVGEYFGSSSEKSVAVYGMMELGRLLVDGLEKNSVKIRYIIDRNVGTGYKNYPMFFPGDELPNVDLIIVTPIVYFEEIYMQLKELTKARIVSIEDIIFPI